MKKLFAILLSCLLLVSCAGGETQNTSGDVSEEISAVQKEESALPADPLAVLPDGQFEGTETVIWTTDLSGADPAYAYVAQEPDRYPQPGEDPARKCQRHRQE